MNSRQLTKLSIPPDCVKPAIAAIQSVRQSGDTRGRNLKTLFKSVLEDPNAFVTDSCLGALARAIIEDRDFVPARPISYRTWGEEGIDAGSHAQMQQACSVSVAAAGALGVIPGTMADSAFVVRGKGHPESLCSAAHGAGRRTSRRKARDTYTWKPVQQDLERKGVRVLSAGADEVPGVYKDIHEVMRRQQDLVTIVARFDPKIVKMCE